MTSAHMNAYAVNRRGRPNSVEFGDAVGELSTDGTLELTLANGNSAVYSHFDPPSESNCKNCRVLGFCDKTVNM